jgi:Fe-S-cluster containining protein
LHPSSASTLIIQLRGLARTGYAVASRVRLRFKCLRCIHCCFFARADECPVVFPWERRLLEDIGARYGLKLRFEPLEVYMDDSGRCAVVLYRWVLKGFCPFYRLASSTCTIHDVKPLACRMYPLIVNVDSGEIVVSTKCDWVETHTEKLRELKGNVSEVLLVFPHEGKAAVEAYVMYRELVTAVNELGLKRVEEVAACRELLDADDYVVRYS